MRGTASSENAVAPALVKAAIESAALLGERKEIVIAPDFKDEACCGLSGCTESTTSAPDSSLFWLLEGKTSAPAVTKASSLAPALRPASDSIATVNPARVSLEMMSGSKATRFSPDLLSATTTMRISKAYLWAWVRAT
jgi:hypothetical protein